MDTTRAPLDEFARSYLSAQVEDLRLNPEQTAVSLNSQIPPHYVTPTITFEDGFSPRSSPLLLVSAAGAMGKSMASQAIASVLGCPRLDLASIIVGQSSHTGILLKALPMSSFACYTNALESGTSSLVIDSLDEASLRSGERAFFAFMESLASDASNFSSYNHQVIIFGRPQNIDLFAAVCEDQGLPVTMAKLDSLSLDSSIELIRTTIERESPGVQAHRTHSGPAHEFWKSYLINLGKRLTADEEFGELQWDAVSDFLGYPPVVSALAPTLARTNYLASLQEQLTTIPAISERSAILLTIVKNLIDRESAKVQQALIEDFSGKLETQGMLPSVYAHEEQIARVLSHLGIQVDQLLPAGLPEELREDYETRLGSFIMDHPFLRGTSQPKIRNVIFSDYLRALVNSQDSTVSMLSAGPLSGSGLMPVGPFYAHFMHAIAPGTPNGSHWSALSNEDYIRDILASWSAAEAPSTTTYASYTHENASDASLVLIMEDRATSRRVDSLDFSITSPSGLLSLDSPVSKISVMSDYWLHISAPNGSVTFGPQAQLVVRQIESTKVDEVVFRGSLHDEGENAISAFIVSESLSLPGDYSITLSPPEAKAFVHAGGLDYRWKKFRPRISSMNGLDPDRVIQALLLTRRILSGFRTTIQGTPAVNADKFHRHIIGRSRIAQSVSDALSSSGLISERNGTVFLDQERLTALGFSYDMYQSPDWEEKMLPVLRNCLNVDRRLVEALKLRPEHN